MAGNLYVVDWDADTVRKISTDGVVTTVAGGGELSPFAADSGPATEAQLRSPWIAVAPHGVLYIADELHDRIVRVDRDGTYTTIAGSGVTGFSGDDGPATEAEVARPVHIAIGPEGSVYYGEQSGRRLRRIDPDGIITTIAGTGIRGFSGDGGPATAARLGGVSSIAFDAAGSVYFSDSEFSSEFGNRVRKIDTDGIITTVAGTGVPGFSGDGGRATEAQLNRPAGIAIDEDGNLYIADNRNHRIRKVTFSSEP